jgi:hypothetical protein
MLIALDTVVRRLRRRLVVVAAALALVGAVVVAHSALADDHMGDAVAACVAVAETAALGIAAAAGTARAKAPRMPSINAATPAPPAGRAPLARARAGPPGLQVFRL